MIYQGDALAILKTLPSESVNICVTSPPYYALRDYGVDGQIGLESTPEEYIKRLVDVFHEVKRVLKDDGTLWVNIGDTYCGTGDKGDYRDPKYAKGRNGQRVSRAKKIEGIKQKDLIGIPWMLAFALRADGWYLRQDIIWQKPNPMPESVTDRCTKSHEYIFLLSKKQGYYYDYAAIQEDAISKDDRRAGQGRIVYGGKREKGKPDLTFAQQSFVAISDKRNKRDVWSVPLKPYSGAHFATFPEKLIEPCVFAGCPKGGVVLDCFNGSGTTGVVCAKNEREYIGIELNPEYVKMSEERIAAVQLDMAAQKAQISFFESSMAQHDKEEKDG